MVEGGGVVGLIPELEPSTIGAWVLLSLSASKALLLWLAIGLAGSCPLAGDEQSLETPFESRATPLLFRFLEGLLDLSGVGGASLGGMIVFLREKKAVREVCGGMEMKEWGDHICVLPVAVSFQCFWINGQAAVTACPLIQKH